MSLLRTVGAVFREVSTDGGCSYVQIVELIGVTSVRTLKSCHATVVVVDRGLQIIPLAENIRTFVDHSLCGLARDQIATFVLAVVVTKLFWHHLRSWKLQLEAHLDLLGHYCDHGRVWVRFYVNFEASLGAQMKPKSFKK